MPLDPARPAPVPFFSLLPKEADRAVVGLGLPRFRSQQVREWVYSKLVDDPAKMSNLSKLDRAALAEHFRFSTSEITRKQSSEDGTIKLLLTWHPEEAKPAAPAAVDDDVPAGGVVEAASGATTPADARARLPVMGTPKSTKPVPQAETVMIPDGERHTACVSSQVGCPVGCRFCASGLAGVKGNLTAGQIVEQVYRLSEAINAAAPSPTAASSDSALSTQHSALKKPRLERITNIVFMGMGEPLANYDNVMKAIRILHDPDCFNIGARKITISTVGVPSRIRDLAEEELPLNLALSLHAPTEKLRRELIPWADHFELDDILEACRYYFDQTGREITLEYILLHNVNDRPEQARQLAQLCKTLRANVNLIRYNEVEGLPYQRPKAEDVMAFQNVLRANGVNAHVRKSRGRDIDAACGQLRRKEQAAVGAGV